MSEPLTHPHPRSRIYRSFPQQWTILDVSSHSVLDLILQKARTAQKPPACVFDLDGTLFDVGYRTLGILQEWLNAKKATHINPEFLTKLAAINYNHIGYSLTHLFENAGFNLSDAEIAESFSSIEKDWKKKFFDGNWVVKYDTVMENSNYFLHEIYKRNIHIVYLTGRYASSMTEGTHAQLAQHNFPLKNCDIVLKENLALEDFVFKSEQIKKIAQKYDVIGNFENEYSNLGHMAKEAPHAVHAIVDSQHSGKMAPDLNMTVYRICQYEPVL